MLQTKFSFLVSYLAAGIIIFLVQTHLLWNSGFLDYDSARNWQIVQEIATGNFEHLFQHASPTFFLFYAVFTLFFKDFHFFIALNCFINVLAILLIGRFIARQFNLGVFQTFMLLVFTGFSGFLTANGRYFTIEAPSLLLFAFILPVYYKRFTKHSSQAFLQIIGFIALGLTINYKFLLLFPVALLLEFIYQDKVLRPKHLLLAGLILITPFLLYALLALWVNLPFYRFPATYAILLYNYQVPNPSSRVGFLQLDFTFYLRYFLRFESPFLLPGILLFPIIFWQKIYVKTRKSIINPYAFLFWIIYLVLIGMHLLQKAPRGLFLIYSLLYAITFICSLQVIKNKALATGFILINVFYQATLLQREIYNYASTNYPKVITYLKDHNITKVATTVGLGITPYTQLANIEVATVFNEKELAAVKAMGYRYILLDDYYLAANIKNFKNLEKKAPLVSWPEPSLMPLYLYLDQSEFAGFSFDDAVKARQQALQDSIQLRILPIP